MNASQDEFSFRALSAVDLDDLFSLHKEIVATLPEPGFLSVRTKTWFEEVIGEKGFVLGSFRGDRLCAYTGVLTPTGPWSGLHDPLEKLGVDRSLVAQGAGTAVHYDYRGLGLVSRLDRIARSIAEARGMQYKFGTLFPKNMYGFKVWLRNGYWIIGTHIDEDGDNLLILRPTRRCLAEMSPGCDTVAIDDIASQLEYLQGGTHVGAPVKIGSCFALRFVPWSTLRTILAAGIED